MDSGTCLIGVSRLYLSFLPRVSEEHGLLDQHDTSLVIIVALWLIALSSACQGVQHKKESSKLGSEKQGVFLARITLPPPPLTNMENPGSCFGQGMVL